MAEVPVFAVVGHPNEGKSSVVSTLTEDDLVPISSVPGETRVCTPYAIRIDGETLVRFIDTPGFQMPVQTLRWMHNYSGPAEEMLADFIRTHEGDPRFSDDCELLRPLLDNAGIVYVVDGSRPLRANDEAEMEILRLTGRPRMAVINPKADETSYVAEWKAAFAKTFNANLQFNAHRATFHERITLLQALQYIEQDWGRPLARVVEALRDDWHGRLEASADAILHLLEESLTLTLADISEGEDESARQRLHDKLVADFQVRLSDLEQKCWKNLKARFLHNKFNADLVAETVVDKDLFAAETWQVLGLTRNQLSLALATAGAAFGAAMDGAAAGTTFGIFTLGGGLAGGLAGWSGTRPLSRLKVDLGPFTRELGGCRVQVGPLRNPQLMFVLLDRALIYFQCVSNWAHARREETAVALPEGKQGMTAGWPVERRRLFEKFQIALQKGYSDKVDALKPKLRAVLLEVMSQEPGPKED
ncbi:small GTP-binding protein domain-containing protein [Geoalkalibacter ferrihydriticus]|uniref:G domain-containing protein n=2 Tax=Geoalkalibacter ferrihydriticus TaxID=392333 RepID=A0A0C2HZJ5_9BACT|nr:DUF3482 domain-containing protein [Geoalkalibacter ferrihydriticus]KIH78127.1 hypothetical protein GFER_06030 [Geoalkalibacter ferrihydriticus DSM 17813]SDM80105.1 small GTP-binding protein domain-containing protein [Geoalkalibacter ferrihydriticus]